MCRRPRRGAPATAFMNGSFAIPVICPAVPRRGPDAGNPHEKHDLFSDFHRCGMNLLGTYPVLKKKIPKEKKDSSARLFADQAYGQSG
jgi:hypothetical protein